jgi:hypothetical protein
MIVNWLNFKLNCKLLIAILSSKSMKKTGTFILACMCFFNCALSQSSINVGFNLSNGGKTFLKNGKLGLGASGEFFQSIYSGGGVRAYVAYDWFHHKISDPDSILRLGIQGQSLSFVPIRIGFQQFLMEKKVFVYADAGYFRILSKSNYLFIHGGFSYSLSAGYKFILDNNYFVQISALYNVNRLRQHWTYNYLTFRLAFGLPFKNLNGKT